MQTSMTILASSVLVVNQHCWRPGKRMKACAVAWVTKLLIIWPTRGYVITDSQGSIAMNALL